VEVPQSAPSGLRKAALDPRGTQSPPPVVSSTSTPEETASSNLASTCALAWVWTRPHGRLHCQSARSCQPSGRWQAPADACASGAGGHVPGRPRPQQCPSRRHVLRRPGPLLPAWLGSRRVSGRAPAFVRWAQPARRLWTGRPRTAACPPAAAPASEVIRTRTHTVQACLCSTNPWVTGHCGLSLTPTPGRTRSSARAWPACQKPTSAWPGVVGGWLRTCSCVAPTHASSPTSAAPSLSPRRSTASPARMSEPTARTSSPGPFAACEQSLSFQELHSGSRVLATLSRLRRVPALSMRTRRLPPGSAGSCSVFSICTTASAPSGSGAPAQGRQHCHRPVCSRHARLSAA